MIREMYNLRCPAGHYHYSPNPKAWIGRACMKALEPLEARSKKCMEPMQASTPPAP